jgi:hypothetical protein
MLKSYFNVSITISIVFTIILYSLLPALAYSQQQQFGFANQSTTIITKNQINNDRQNSSPSHTFSAYTTTGKNNNHNNNNSTSRGNSSTLK